MSKLETIGKLAIIAGIIIIVCVMVYAGFSVNPVLGIVAVGVSMTALGSAMLIIKDMFL